MPQRVRVEADREIIRHCLLASNYPFDVWLDNPEYFDQCIAASVFEGDTRLALIWGHFVEDGVMTGHAASISSTPLDWAGLMPRLVWLAGFMGADEVMISLEQTAYRRPLGILLRRHGFVQAPNSNTYRRPTHG